MAAPCRNCLAQRSLVRIMIRRKVSSLSRILNRMSSTLPFSSDRDPTEAERVPIYKYIGKNHKRTNMLFACGFNFTGALGIPDVDAIRRKAGCWSYPHRMKLFDLKITTVDCGYGYTVLGSNTKDMIKVYGMGINTESQLSYQLNRETPTEEQSQQSGYFDYVMEISPISIPFQNHAKTRVKQVACGRAHTLVLTDNEGIFTFGNNAFGQCGRRIIEGEIYQGSRKIHQIPHSHFSSPITQVSCGMDHSLFLTKNGQVYACGWGADGQTGLGSYERADSPTLLKGDLEGVRVKKITTFADMSMAICEDGHLYGWGNSEYYQLGSVTEETQVHTPVRLPFDKSGKIIDAASGGTICCLLNNKGEVSVWGYGVLGKGPDLKDTKYPQKIPMTLFGGSVFNPGVKVKKVKCGMNYFAAVTNRGELFTWGRNKSSCLGIGHSNNQYFPWKVLMPGEVTDVHCGVDHTIVVAKSIL